MLVDVITKGRFGNQLWTMAYAISQYGLEDVEYACSHCPYVLKICKGNNVSVETGSKYSNMVVDYHVSGYHQNYDEMNWDLVRKCYKCPKDIEQQILAEYPNISNMVVCHVRRGDFVYSQSTYRILNPDYIKRVKDKYFPNNQMLIVSDDVTWCEQNVPGFMYSGHDVLFDFYCMVMAKGIIASASTYSIMACCLNPTGICIIPEPLYTNKGRDNDKVLRIAESHICPPYSIREPL